MNQIEAEWPFKTEFLVAVRRSGGAIEHYLQAADNALEARKQVEEALIDRLAVIAKVK